MDNASKQQKQIEKLKLKWKMQNNVVNEGEVDKINIYTDSKNTDLGKVSLQVSQMGKDFFNNHFLWYYLECIVPR